ncbi:MAG: type II secretion system minor pseudopilin GspJ [Pseudomonadota bacterium]
MTRTPTSPSSRQGGFTLVELLIALTVFAFVGAASVGVMSLATNTQAQLSAVTEEVGHLERARSLIRADLLQIVDRPYQEPLSFGTVSSVLGGVDAMNALDPPEGELYLLAFVRNGWINPRASQPRASLQHVLYLVRDGAIIRRTRPFLDAVDDTPTAEQVLFKNVEGVEAQFKVGTRWVDDWIATGEVYHPAAFRLRFAHPRYGEMEQLFLIGGLPQ